MDDKLKRGFRIGPFAVDPLSGRIQGPTGSHHVQPKVMDVLLCLTEHAGALVERDTILNQVWRRATSEEVLTRCISELRHVFGDDRGTPKYIQTVPKRGYRLLESVTVADPERAGASAAAPRALRPVTVLLVDDHALFREGIKLQLREHDEAIVCLEAASCEEALTFATRDVDLILLDYGLPGLKGLEAIAKIKEAFSAPVTIVSASDDAPTIRAAIKHGAMGFIPKAMSKKEFFAALGLVRAGVVYLPPQVLYGTPAASRAELTELQRQVLSAALRGKTDDEIAEDLSLAKPEVEANLRSAYRALGVDDRIDAVYELAKRGLSLG